MYQQIFVKHLINIYQNTVDTSDSVGAVISSTKYDKFIARFQSNKYR